MSTPADGQTPAISRRNSEINLTDQTNLLPRKKIIVVFLSLSLCVLAAALDSVIVSVTLPTITAAFQAGKVVSWVPSAYLLTSTGFQPMYGRFSDIFGRKAALCASLTIFMIGNLIAGFSKSIKQMIVARGIAGAGGGGIISMMQIIVSDIVTLRERGKYQGFIGVVVAFGYTVGPLIGGALSQKVGWAWCFWITIPPSLIATIGVIIILPLKPVEGDIKKKLLAVDYLGSLLTLAGCALIILPLIWGGVTFPWKSAIILGPLVSGFVVVVLFCLWEWKGARLPIVPMYIFKQVTVCGVYIAMFINGYIFFSTIYYLPQYFQVVLRYTPLHSGTFLIPILVSQMVANWGSGMTISRTGHYRTIIYSGFAVWAIGCGCISTITPSSSQAVMVVFMLLVGLGAGQTLQTTTVAAQASVPRKDMAVVTAFRNFIRLLGGTLSLSVGSATLNNSLNVAMKSLGLSSSIISSVVDDPAVLSNPSSVGLSVEDAAYVLRNGYTKGFRTVFLVHASLATLATITSILMIKHKDLTRGDEERLKQEAIQYAKDQKSAHAAKKLRSGTTTPKEEVDIEMGDVPKKENEVV
ncbi:MFS general substrate transporter [Mycena floridula]|nr:MFS general substrate transporter [Mycena floridula]